MQSVVVDLGGVRKEEDKSFCDTEATMFLQINSKVARYTVYMYALVYMAAHANT